MLDNVAAAPLPDTKSSESCRRSPDVLLAEALERIARARGPHANAVRRIVGFIEDNLAENITLDDFARTAQYGHCYAARIFKKITGITPGRFLSYMRYAKAMELLRTTDLGMVAIANRVGFYSVGSFSLRFHLLVGLPPSEYRELAHRTVESADQTVHGQEIFVA